MKRREFFGSSIGMVAASALPALAALPPQEAATEFPQRTWTDQIRIRIHRQHDI